MIKFYLLIECLNSKYSKVVHQTKHSGEVWKSMHFIEKYPQGRKPLIMTLSKDVEAPPECDQHAMNFWLLTQAHQEVASGRCSVQSEPRRKDFLYISAIYVEGNSNTPTKKNPNQFVGLGQLLVFAAIKYGFEMKIEQASLVPVDDSQGFYLKMGFHPTVVGAVNRMDDSGVSLKSGDGKLNPQWLNRFSQSSFQNENFRGANWSGNINNIYVNLRSNIMKNWEIVG